MSQGAATALACPVQIPKIPRLANLAFFTGRKPQSARGHQRGVHLFTHHDRGGNPLAIVTPACKLFLPGPTKDLWHRPPALALAWRAQYSRHPRGANRHRDDVHTGARARRHASWAVADSPADKAPSDPGHRGKARYFQHDEPASRASPAAPIYPTCHKKKQRAGIDELNLHYGSGSCGTYCRISPCCRLGGWRRAKNNRFCRGRDSSDKQTLAGTRPGNSGKPFPEDIPGASSASGGVSCQRSRASYSRTRQGHRQIFPEARQA